MLRRAQQRGLTAKVVTNPAGAEKMSDVLTDFFEPYHEGIPDTLDTMRKLVMTAVVAWNTALLPVEERADKLQQFSADLPEEMQEDFMVLVDDMIRRKETYFANHNRIILDYELTDQGGGDYHLSVMSTVPAKDSESE
jgi:hypothetical protein